MKNQFIKIASSFLSVFMLAIISGCSRDKADKPNIVFILVDQWRASATGYAGDPNVKTPYLDKFAEQAICFNNVVSVCPVCTPFRASLFTGMYPTSTGMFLNDAYLPEEELCLAEVFKDNGYNTGYIGKWHLDGHGRFDFTPPERRQGFDYWKALECSHDYNKMAYYEGNSSEVKYWEGYSPFALTEDAQGYISRHADGENPFFLFVSIAAPHFPHQSAPDEFKDLYPEEEIQIAPNVPSDLHQRVKKELVGYYAHCSATDKAIGELIMKMKELDLMDNTIIVFTSDHGDIMGAHGINVKQKQVPWTESAGVPLLISYPLLNRKKGRSFDMPLTTPDISATVLGLAGLKIPDTFEGEDFANKIMSGKDNPDHGALYMGVAPFANVRNEAKKEYRALKTGQYTYVKSIDGAWLFFDDIIDPFQMNNLVSNPEYMEIQANLDKQLMSVLKKNDDDFKPAKFYISRWGYKIHEAGHIPYKSFDQKPQSPQK